jgi:hypothetical protein
MWYYYTNKGDNLVGQCMGSMAIKGGLDSMVDKNVEKADMCKCNLYYTTVGMEGAEQEEVEVWIVQHE